LLFSIFFLIEATCLIVIFFALDDYLNITKWSRLSRVRLLANIFRERQLARLIGNAHYTSFHARPAVNQKRPL
jgi:hypothetical protein